MPDEHIRQFQKLLPLFIYSALAPVQTLEGPWTVQFDPKWGGPEQPVTFESLQDWTQRAEDGIKYYSGTAPFPALYQFAFKMRLTKATLPVFRAKT